jgi:ankyrin repeat protein
MSSVWEAAQTGKQAAVEKALRGRVEWQDLSMAIQGAAEDASAPAILTLLLRAVPKDKRVWILDSALRHAAGAGANAKIALLLDAGAKADGAKGEPPLLGAIESGSTDAVAILLKRGADPSKKKDDHDALEPIFLAIERKDAKLVKLLVDAGADLKVGRYETEERPLDVARRVKSKPIEKILLAAGAKPLTDEDLDLPGAADLGREARVRALLAKKPKKDDVEQALVMAAQAGHASLVTLLAPLVSAAKPRASAMYYACQNGHADALGALLAAGIPIDDAESTRLHFFSPLMMAVAKGHTAIVKKLLAAGADPNFRESGGKTAIQIAKEGKHKGMLPLLEKAGGDAAADAKIAKKVLALANKLARPAWRPSLEDGPGAAMASRFGGSPWMAAGEKWPACAACKKPLSFFAQIDLATTPAPAKLGKGLLQVFHCAACDDGDLVRIVNAPRGGTAAVSKGKKFPARRITRWSAESDLPYRDPIVSKTRWPTTREHVEHLLFRRNLQGDKLGGWPCWVQEPGWGECDQLLLQISSGNAVPYLWADNGAAWILRSTKTRALKLVWQSP